MSPSDALLLVGEIIMLASAVFIVYRALTIRRVLIDRPYRARALWTAIGALSVVSFIAAGYVDDIFGQTPTTAVGVIVEDIIWGFTFLALYGWIVTNINVAITADFFNREPLYWKKGGRIAAPAVLLTAYVLASIPPWWIPQSLQAESNLVLNTITALFAIVTLYAIIVLALTYRRIKDKTIKTYTMWVVLSIIGVSLLLFVPTVLIIIPAIMWVYCMYRSVGSLTIRTRNLGQI